MSNSSTTISAAPVPKNELHSLQIVRAVASTSVVYFHIGSVPCFGGVGPLPCFGGFGVDIFFVLSGFIIAMVVATGQSPSNFAINRVSRIVPLYWVLTAVLLILAALTPALLNSTTANASNFIKSILFIPYFKENGTLMPMLFVGWSLNYEMFFYLSVWLALVTARKHFIVLSIGILLVAYVGFGKLINIQVLNKFFGNEQIFEFILGMLAYLTYQSKHLNRVPKTLVLCLGLAGYIFMASAEANGVNGIGVKRLLLFGIPSLLLVCSAVCLEGVIRSSPRSIVMVLVAIGNASYATYLTHVYVTEAVRKLMFQKWHLIDINEIFGVSVSLLIALIVGGIVYKLVDKPLSHLLKVQMAKLKKRPVVLPLSTDVVPEGGSTSELK